MRRFLKFLLAPAGWGSLVLGLTLGYLGYEHVVKPYMVDQVVQVQRARTDFAVRCDQHQGRIVYLPNDVYVCTGPDGRWLEWY